MGDRVFVSYSRRNKIFAERLARDLSDAGLEVWIDFRQIQGGELWQDEIYRGIERSDFLVACLSPEAAASEWVTREIMTAREQDKRIIPVMVQDAVAQLRSNRDLSWILDVHFINFSDRYEQAFPELLNALPGKRRVGVFDKLDPENIPNPFKGLEAFQQTDAQFFFGREEMVARALGRMRRTRFLAVVGSSGSGKSSLVRAGVIPRLRAGVLDGSDHWPIIIFTPGQDPTQALAVRLMPLLQPEGDGGPTLEDLMARLDDPATGEALLNELLDEGDGQMVIVVDQFEEVFTRASAAERDPFLALLLALATGEHSRARVIITMRADFFGHLSHYPELAQLFEQENMIIVTDMTPANLLRVIEGPAEAVGLRYESGLVDRILADVSNQPGSLPLLQYALSQLFDRRDGPMLTMAAYDEIGGVRRALGRHAEAVYETLSPEQQDITRRVMMRLVEVGETGEPTRRRVDRGEMTFKGVDDTAVQAVIDRLTAPDARLLVASREIRASEDPQDIPLIWLEVSHEALIREWERLSNWISANLENLRYNSELSKAAYDWNTANRDPAYLLRGRRLTRAEVWLETADASALQREFIEISLGFREEQEAAEKARQERELTLQRRAANQLRVIAAVLVVGLVIALGLVGVAVNATTEARAANTRLAEEIVISNRRADVAQSLALSASAKQLLSDNDPDLALALALQSADIEQPPAQTQATLAEVAFAPGTRLLIRTGVPALYTVDYSPDGSLLAHGGSGGLLVLRDPATGAELRTLGAEGGHSSAINDMAFSPDSRLLLTASQDALILWDAAAGDLLRRLSGHTGAVNGVAFHPQGLAMLSAGADGQIIEWSVQNGQPLRYFAWGDEARPPVTHAAYSPHGLQIAAGTDDNNVLLYDRDSGEVLWRFRLTEARSTQLLNVRVTALAFLPDNNGLVVGYNDGNLVLLDTATGTINLRFAQIEAEIHDAAVTPDGRRLVVGTSDGSLRLWEVATGRLLRSFSVEAPVWQVDLSRDGRRLATAIGDGTLRIWSVVNSEQERIFSGHGSAANATAFSPDGTRALSASSDRTLILWDLAGGQQLFTLTGHAASVNAVTFAPDGRTALSGGSDGQVILWDLQSGALVRRFEGDTSTVLAVAFSPDGRRVLAASIGGQVNVWDVSTGQQSTYSGHSSAVLTAVFSPDGTAVLSGDNDGRLHLWTAADLTLLRAYEGHSGAVRSALFNADGSRLLSASSDAQAILWDTDSGAVLQRFVGHVRAVTAAAFTQDPGSVVSAGFDGTIRLWDVESGAEVRRYAAVRDDGRAIRIQAMAHNPVEMTVITALNDGTLRLWLLPAPLSALLEWIEDNRHLRPLSCDEQQRFDLPLAAECVTVEG